MHKSWVFHLQQEPAIKDEELERHKQKELVKVVCPHTSIV